MTAVADVRPLSQFELRVLRFVALGPDRGVKPRDAFEGGALAELADLGLVAQGETRRALWRLTSSGRRVFDAARDPAMACYAAGYNAAVRAARVR